MRVSKIILFFLSSTMAIAQTTKQGTFATANETQEVNTTTLQVSEFYGGFDCTTKEANIINVINAAIDGVRHTCLELNATDVIDINDYFEAEYGSEFDATIVSELTGGTGTGGGDTGGGTGGGDTGGGTGGGDTGGGTGGGDTGGGTGTTDPGGSGGYLDPTPDSEKVCEDLTNHGPANPHLYSHASSNTFTGDLMAKYAPEYMVEGLTGWKKMYTAGLVASNTDLKYFFFHEPSDGAERNIILRTKAGCPEFRDVRNQRVNTNTLEDWYGLPATMPALANPTPIDVNFMINSELENRGLWENIAVYNLFADRYIGNMAMKVNGYSYAPFREYTYPMFLVRGNHTIMDTPALLDTYKDFYIDVSTDNFNSAARYTVYRNYQGGHWSVVTTATRHDGRVTVTAQGISWEMDQQLVNLNTGQVYPNVSTFGNVFDLGFLGDGDYVFALRTYNGVTINNRILVRVKRPPLN